MEVRTGRLVNEQPPGLFTEHTDRFIVENDKMNSYTEAESDMSLKSRSFLHRVNDRVRRMQDQSSKDATQGQQQTFFNMVNVSVFDITSICVHVKKITCNFYIPINNTGKDLTMKQMFDIS